MAKTCTHPRPKGGLCGRPVKKGREYCAWHHKKTNGLVKTGKQADMKKLLGLSKGEELSYSEFLKQNKPHELQSELFQLRSLLVEYRNSYHALSEGMKEMFLEEAEDFIASYLISEGMVPEKAYKLSSVILPGLADAYDSKLSSLDLSEDYIKTVSKLLRDIAFLAEKSVKMKEGMTINLKVEGDVLISFIQEVVFVVVTSQMDRARLAQLTQVWLGKTTDVQSDPDIVEAEFEMKG